MQDEAMKAVIKSQYHAGLAMLRQTVASCPENSWDTMETVNRFWHVAYHVLFYTHLYLQPTGADFVPWEKHREHYESLGRLPYPPYEKPVVDIPYRKAEIMAYLDFCVAEVGRQIDVVDLAAESGFSWIPFGKLELQFYNIRHIQHHTAELSTMLMIRENIEIDWVGMGPTKK